MKCFLRVNPCRLLASCQSFADDDGNLYSDLGDSAGCVLTALVFLYSQLAGLSLAILQMDITMELVREALRDTAGKGTLGCGCPRAYCNVCRGRKEPLKAASVIAKFE